ncbi:hypothetical protein RhiirA4_482101 [Rhizophagus irregularis]|uniref:Uncharacterized protein n=1 Tax=Rhizophagus irregularis TaxID=588596 RepID=A0A2I1HKI1_9GLOM|nr:hypothetical protein RhiirA4_482101 [Rhizophagus irregularis]
MIKDISSFARNNDRPDPVMQTNAPANELLKFDKHRTTTEKTVLTYLYNNVQRGMFVLSNDEVTELKD